MVRPNWLLLLAIGLAGAATAWRAEGAAEPPLPQVGPNRTGPGPWDQDVLVYRVAPGGEPEKLATFERAGVPTVARLRDGRLVAAFQHFPVDDDRHFDRVAVRFSRDEGRTWTPPQPIVVEGMEAGLVRPFDPTLVSLPDGRVRLYFTSNRTRDFRRSTPAIYSAASDDGVRYAFEPGVRFGLEGRIVIDCAAALHDGVFHLIVPDNGTAGEFMPGPGPAGKVGPGAGARRPSARPEAITRQGRQAEAVAALEQSESVAGRETTLSLRPSAGLGALSSSKGSNAATVPDQSSRNSARRIEPGLENPPRREPPGGSGYHAISRDGLFFERVADVKLPSTRDRWLGNLQSDGGRLVFFGTGPGPWPVSSRDGLTWEASSASLRVPGADPGAVKLRDGAWLLLVTGPPRPGTPSALRRGAMPGPPPGGDAFPRRPPGVPGDGRYGGSPAPDRGPQDHRVLLASSRDGLNWTVAGDSLAEHASVPELFAGPEGRLILLFVDASGAARPGALGAMVRDADGRWGRVETNLRGADPNVVRLRDGTYRAYTKEPDGSIVVFSSRDGLRWDYQGVAFHSDRYPHATDADVFETSSGWVMLISLGPRLLRCTSRNGIEFTTDGTILDLGGSVCDTVAVPGGWRTYFHVNASPRTGGRMLIRSAFTADGRTWQVEDGDRLAAPPSGPAQYGVADPAPVQLEDGTWLMAIKSFRTPPRPPAGPPGRIFDDDSPRPRRPASPPPDPSQRQSRP